MEIRNQSVYYNHLNGNATKGHSNAKTHNTLLYRSVNIKQVPTYTTNEEKNQSLILLFLYKY